MKSWAQQKRTDNVCIHAWTTYRKEGHLCTHEGKIETKMSKTYCQNEFSDPILQKRKCPDNCCQNEFSDPIFQKRKCQIPIARMKSQIQFFKNKNAKHLLPE